MKKLVERSAQEIIASFPAVVVCDAEGLHCETRFILIKPGETGYYPVTMVFDTIDDASERYARAYHTYKATPAQRRAALVGSMRGWDVPGADPLNCEE